MRPDNIEDSGDQDERIEIAEKVLLLIAYQLREAGVSKIRDVLEGYINQVTVDKSVWEIIECEVFLQVLAEIGLDLDSEEQLCLMSVLQKPQLGNTISIEELEEIMQSVNEELAEMSQSKL